MNISLEKYQWITFIIPFFLLFLILHYSFLSTLVISFFIYCFLGGWKFIKILILTGPRDIHGLICLLKVRFVVWNMKRQHFTIPDIFEATVKRKPLQIAFLYEEEKWSFDEINKLSNKVANYLLKLGVKSGDTIGLFMESRPAYVAIWIGLSKIGAIPALINFNLRQKCLVHCLKDVQACGLIYGSELNGAVHDIYEQIAESSRFKIAVDNLLPKKLLNGMSQNVDSVHDRLICAESNNDPPNTRHTTRKYTDTLIYIFTSGTTGLPKAAKISHSRFIMMSYGVSCMLSIHESDIIYNPLPLYHTAGGMIGVGQVLIKGCTMVIRRKFSVSSYWKDCLKYQATVVQYIGEICRYLLSQPVKPEEYQHKVRLAFGNGIRPQIWEEFQKRFKIKQIGEFYGATESNANIVNSVNKVGSVGFGTRILPVLYPITLIKIDENTGLPLRDKNGLCIQCKPNETGELVGKIQDKDPARQFDGYISETANQRKIISNVFSHSDQAFLTGDLLIQDELGFFYFKDRLGDTFRWKGENVSTAEVEAVISNCLQLNDCAVYGVSIPGTEGRAGMAAIVNTDNSYIDLGKLAEKLQENLPSYAKPVFFRMCQNIDMTGTFKMKKTDLVKEGFNPDVTQDKMFYFDLKSGQYLELNCLIYEQIMKGFVKF